MTRKSGLGRGLGALIPENETSAGLAGVNYVHVNAIIPNPRQPRSQFHPEEIDELATSIRQHGILQPLIVSYEEENSKYILIAGERRWLAAKQAGLDFVPAIIREVSDQERLELALVENLQRTDLNPLEAAEAYRQLSEDFHCSHEQISMRVGKSRAAITNTIRLLKLPFEIKQALIENKISEGHARSLLSLPTPESQTSALHTILSHNLNVRQTEELIRRLLGETPKRPLKSKVRPELAAFEDRLRSHLGTKVKLYNREKGGGTITIHYYSDEELNALIKTLLGELD